MDRQIIYPGSIPLDTDLLKVQRNTLIGLSALTKTVLGSSPVVDGLACSPSGPGYAVAIGPGTLSTLQALDSMPFGSLPAEPAPMLKTGVNLGSSTLQLGITADQGAVICWLIQASLEESDDQPLALQYWNASEPTIPFSGPGNSGAAQNTRRATKIKFSSKASSPVPVGTFAPPAADPGWVGLFGVTTWVGKPAITVEDIQTLPTAPILPFYLPDLTPGFSRQIIITSSTTWTVPARVARLRVRVVGGGGGGGGGSTTFGGGGGGAGGYAEGIVSVVPGRVFPVIIGGGGPPSGPTVTGGNGGLTNFGDLVAAQGGLGGASANPDSHGGSGGVGSSGALLLLGGTGGDGPMIAGVPAGNGGASAFGGGGRGSNGGGAPANGRAPGSGAGGGYGGGAFGGQGAPGIALIEF